MAPTQQVIPPWGVDPAPSSASRSRATPPRMLAQSVAQRRRLGVSGRASQAASDYRAKQRTPAKQLYTPRPSPASPMAGAAQRVLNRQKYGQLSARSVNLPDWEQRKREAFAYAESIDGQAEVTKQAGSALRVEIPGRAGAPTEPSPSSPAQLIKSSRDPWGAEQAESARLESARADLWGYSGSFIKAQFEGEKPGYDYRAGRQGAGYYKIGVENEAPRSPAQLISSSIQQREQRPSNEFVPSSIRRATKRPGSAHPGGRGGANAVREKPVVPSLELSGSGIQSLGVSNRPKPRPKSAAISRSKGVSAKGDWPAAGGLLTGLGWQLLHRRGSRAKPEPQERPGSGEA